MALADKYKRLEVRTNADTPEEAKVARSFGATGIGLCRTEHMFFEGERINAVREMILADDEAGRRKALAKLLPMQRGDFEGLFREMSGLPVTIRLLDPPLHEFVPHDEAGQKVMAQQMGVSLAKIRMRVDDLAEFNPMLGHRGCRLGITYPEITEMQARAIFEAGLNMKAQGVDVRCEIMVPLVGTVREFNAQAAGDPRRGGAGLCRARRRARLHAGHDDRDAARRAGGRQHRQAGRVLQLRHQRPDADDDGLLARRRRQVPARVPEEGPVRTRPLPQHRPEGRGPAGGDGGAEGPRRARRTSSWACAANTAATRPRWPSSTAPGWTT